MSRFKVGDILIGTEENGYGITNQYNEVKVIDVDVNDGDREAMSVSVVDVHNVKDSEGRSLTDSSILVKSAHRGNIFQVSERLFKYSERRLKLQAIQEVLDG